MNLEYAIVKIWRRNALENVQANNKMASQLNVATDNMTSQCFYVKVHQIFGKFILLFLLI